MSVRTQALGSFKTGKGFSKNSGNAAKRIQPHHLSLLLLPRSGSREGTNDNQLILARAVRSLQSWSAGEHLINQASIGGHHWRLHYSFRGAPRAEAQ